MTNIAVIGCGYWGPNLIRNFAKLKECQLVAAADQGRDRLDVVKFLCPTMRLTTSAEEILEDKTIEGVAIATPISTHFPIAQKALAKGKHVFIEKPMTATSDEAEELTELAAKNRRVLMVDHTFIYTGAVRKLRSFVESGELGEIYYYDSVRINLGLFQHDANVLWDLAPHDFAIMDYLIPKRAVSVSAVGSSPVRWNGWRRESLAYISVDFEDGTLAHFHVNWLSPVKLRRTLIGGSRKMIIYDHLDPDNQLKIYDKGVEIKEDQERYQALVQYRTGDLLAPKIDQTEALSVACRHFVHCIQNQQRPETDGMAGLRVVRLLEAAQHSMNYGGRRTQLWEGSRRAQVASG